LPGKLKVLNVTKNTVLVEEARLAASFLSRLQGLLGRKELPRGQGLILKPCQAVHTLGMRFPIDVAFVDRHDRICHLIEDMPPFRFSPVVKEARYVIEAPAGTWRAAQAAVGDRVASEECP